MSYTVIPSKIDAASTDQVTIDVDGNDKLTVIGLPDSILAQFPTNVLLPIDATAQTSTAYIWYRSLGAQTWNLFLPAGTYTFHASARGGTTSGSADVTIDATTVGTMDSVLGANGIALMEIASVNVTSSANVAISITANGDGYFYLLDFGYIRTGDAT